MLNRFFPPDRIGLEDFPVVPCAIAAIVFEKLLAIVAIEPRQPVPRDGRIAMMDEMEIVVEKEEGEKPAILVDDGAIGDRRSRLMLDECANREDRQRRISEGQEVDERAHPRQPADPSEDRYEADQTKEPRSSHITIAAL